MKTKFTFLILLSLMGLSRFLNAQTFIQKANFIGATRGRAICFALNGKGYYGTGNSGSSSSEQSDMYSYDPTTNSWSQIASTPNGMQAGIGFSIGNKGYAGIGWWSGTCHNNFWEYDPTTNAWTSKANYTGSAVNDAAGFSINNLGYVGTGAKPYSSCTTQFYEYNPTSNSWTQKADFTGSARRFSFGISIGSYGYLGCGTNEGTTPFATYNTCYKYDQTSNTWTSIANFPASDATRNSAIVINGILYVFYSLSSTDHNMYSYDPSTNTWTLVSGCPFINGTDAAFVINGKGYFLESGTNRFWEFTPCTTPSQPATPTGTTQLCINPPNTNYTTTGATNATAYVWQISPSGAGTITGTGTTATVVWNKTFTGTATIQVQGTNGTCVGNFSNTLSVTISPLPIVTFSALSPVCINTNSFTLSGGTPNGGLYSGTGVSNNIFNPSISGVGKFTITYTYTDGNSCSNSATQNITVNSPPLADAGSNQTICLGNTAILTASGGTSYLWNNNAGSTATVTVKPIIKTTYTITVTDNNKCSATDFVVINVNSLPLADAGTNQSICVGNSKNLTATGGTLYSWSNNAGTTAIISVKPNITTTYTVTVTDNNKCSATDFVVVNVNPLPIVSINSIPNYIYIKATPLTLSGNPTGGTFSGTGVTGTTFNPTTAKLGNAVINYNYTNVNGCSGKNTTSTIVFDTIEKVCSDSIQNIAQIPKNGLVAYYPFNGNANDESGNGNNGTVNGATLTTDRFGNTNAAYSFSTTSNIIVPNFTISKSTISVSFWFNTKNVDNARPINHDWNNGTFSTAIVKNQFCVAYMTSGGGFTHYDQSDVISINNWYHAVIVNDGSTSYIYLNGILKSTMANNGTLSLKTANLVIGDNRSGFFSGKVDDIRIYNRVLNSTEISSLYNEGICNTTRNVTDTLFINANITGYNPIAYQNNIKIYPNPTFNQITIDCGSNYNTINNYTIKITNSLSQTVYTSVINKQTSTIDLKSWTGKGIYFIQLIDGSNNIIENKKIVLQ